MTIYCGETVPSTNNLLLTSSSIVTDSKQTSVVEEVRSQQEDEFSWCVYPPTLYGDFFRDCVDDKLIDSKGNWIYPTSIDLPPIDIECWERINTLLSKSITIKSKSLDRLPPKKQILIIQAFYQLEEYCKINRLINPITYNKKNNRLVYEVFISAIEILGTIHSLYPWMVNGCELHGGGVPFLLQKEYYVEAVNLLPLKKKPSKDIYTSLLNKPADYDLRLFLNGASYENIEGMFDSVLSLFAEKLLFMGGDNKQLKFIIRETSFESISHIITEDKHFKQFSFGGSQGKRFDFTLVDKLANEQLFHCHGLSIDLDSFVYPDINKLSVPYGTVANGWKAIIDKLTQIVTVENNEYSYHQGWYRLLSYIYKGSWSPDPTLEPTFRKSILGLPKDNFYKNLMHVFSQHTHKSDLSKVCIILTASSFMDNQLTDSTHRNHWETIDSKYFDDWLKTAVSSIKGGYLSTHEVLDIIQIGAVLQCMAKTEAFVICHYYESSEQGFVSIQFSRGRNIVIPLNLKRAILRVSSLLTQQNPKATILIRQIITAFIRNVEKSDKKCTSVEQSFPEEISDVADLLGDIQSIKTIFVSTWLNLKGYGACQGLNRVTMKLTSIITEPLSNDQKKLLIQEYSSFLRKNRLMGTKSSLWNFTKAVVKNYPIQQVSFGLLQDLLRSSNSSNFSHVYNIWIDFKEEFPRDLINTMVWFFYQRATELNHELSVDILTTITKNQRRISKKMALCWSQQIFDHIDHVSFKKILKLTDLIISKTPRNDRHFRLDQKSLILFFNKLFEEKYFKNYVQLLTLAFNKKTFFWKNIGIQKQLIQSLEVIAVSQTSRMIHIIDLWEKIDRLNLTGLVTNTTYYQQLIGILIERSYCEGFDDYGDHLLFNYAKRGEPLFNDILKKRIDQRKVSQQSSELLNEVEKYSGHLTKNQMIAYTVDALQRNINKGDLSNSIHICIGLLGVDLNDNENTNKFISSLNIILKTITDEPKKQIEHLTYQLLAHEQLHWYVHQNSINEIQLKWVENTSTDSITLKIYEQLIDRIETLNEYQQFFLTESFVAYLSTLNREIIGDINLKVILNRLFEQKLSALLSMLTGNEQSTQVLLLYNSLSRLRIYSHFNSTEYAKIFTSFINMDEFCEKSQTPLETCKYFKQQITHPSFYLSERFPYVMDAVFKHLSHQNDEHELAIFYRKCVQLLNKIQSESDKDSLISTLSSVQMSMMQSGDISCGMNLLKILTSSSQIKKELIFKQLQETKQFLNTDNDLGHINNVLSRMSPLSMQKPQSDIFEAECIKITNEIGSKIGVLSVDELISFTEIVLKDNAQLWNLLYDNLPVDIPKQNLNLVVNRFYNTMITGAIIGSQNDIEKCFFHLFSITEKAPVPFVSKFLNNPEYLSKLLSSCSEKSIPIIQSNLVLVLQEYIRNCDPNSEALCRLHRVRTKLLRCFLEKEFSREISEFDQQLIVWSCEKLDPSLYYETCLLFREFHERSLLCHIDFERLIDFFLEMPFLENREEKISDSIVEVNHNLLNHFLPNISDNTALQLKVCLKIVSINHPLFYENAAKLSLNILNHSDKPSEALKNVLTILIRNTNLQSTEECFTHKSLKKYFTPEGYQELVYERICSQIRFASSANDLKIQKQVFETSLELLNDLSPSGLYLKDAISHFWDITITLYTTDPNCSYSLEEIHQKVCFLAISPLFSRCVEKQFVLQLWKYSKLSSKKDTLAVRIFFHITADFQKKLLDHPTKNTKVQQSVTSFVHQNIGKIILNHPDQKIAYLPIIDKFIDYSLMIADESLFDYCVRSLQKTYRKAVVNNFFETFGTTLLRCIYFSELKDVISSPIPIRDRQHIVAKMIHYISLYPNHVSLRHGFTLLSSIGSILYLQHPDRLLSLYHKLLSQLPQFLYEDVHYVFYNKKNKRNADQTLETVQQIMGSSPNINTIKNELKIAGAKLNMIPLFECVRQHIMPGDVVQFSQWDKYAQKYSTELIDHFYHILLEAYTQNKVPESKSFDSYNTIWYLCDMLLKGIEFHGFDTNPKKYFDYALELIPYIRELLNDPRLQNRNGLYDVFEKLILQKVKETSSKQQQLLVVHTWIMTLLQIKSPSEVSRGTKLFSKAKQQNLYQINSVLYKEALSLI